ncbi:MAG: sensor histidine kinase, partial [Planctomycetota bacterium]
TTETIELVYQLSYPDNPKDIGPTRAADVMRYRVFLAKCLFDINDERLFGHLRRVIGNSHYNNEPVSGFLIGPAETTIWQLEKLMAIARQAGLADRLKNEIQSAENHIMAYENVIEAADLYPSTDHFQAWPNQSIRRLSPGLDFYGFKFTLADKTILGISTYERLLGLLAAATKDMQDDTVEVQISDNFGNVIIGDVNKTEKPFLTLKAGKFMPDFTVSVFFKDTSVFEKAARRQTSIYIWTGILVALLILSAGAVSIRTVNHQIKMNRLKNDFIATVTHELKTPLASMRLLVDTLLEGNYEGEQTATEYLQLVANENKRLTHLIDSFLTFSRMERNKQVFEIAAVSPVEVAKIAVEAVRTKFENGNVIFNIDVQKSLPMMYADKDGIITTIINLLDNAYKYTNGDKQIELKAYEQNGSICFVVRDNGIGLSVRTQKKIFNRFYQVDSRLSRRTEGCGLGLSIVKFIVDAHKGSIEVESTPGKGSTFLVKLPCCKG